MSSRFWLSMVGGLVLASATPAAVRAAEPEPLPSAWTFDGGLYAWAIWVQGDVTTRGLNFDVYADPIDLIDALDGPIIMANFEAKRGRFALYADVVYGKFRHEADFLREVNPIPALTLKGDARIGADYELGIYQATGFYEVAHFTGAKGNTTLEFGGGARWVRQELDVTLGVDLSATLELERKRLAKHLDFSKSRDLAFANTGVMEWVDPLIAMRTTHAFGDGQSFTAMGDVGGFNTDSDFSWQVVLTYDRDGTFLGFDTTTSIGYKALGLLFEEQTSKGARGVDIVLHGPIAELTFHW